MEDSRGELDVRWYRVEGRVQGVGFRWWTRETAMTLGLQGRVRNLTDGAVEVRATGPTDALDRLEAELGRGPGSARVSRVEPQVVGSAVRREAAEWSSFEIERA